MATKKKWHLQWGTVLGTAGVLFSGPASAQMGDDFPDLPSSDDPAGLFDVGDDPAAGESNVNVDSFGKIDLAVKDLEIAKVLQLLSIQSQKNIVTSRNVSGSVSADLYGVTFHEALEAILSPNGFGYEEKGNFIYVYTAAELQERKNASRKMVTRIIRLNYLNGEDAKTIAESLLSDGGKVTFSASADDGFLPSTSDGGSNSYASPDAIILRDYAESVDEIEALIAQLDVRPKQVLVEATVLQAQLTEKNAFGVDFAAFTNLNAFDFANPLNAVNNLIGGGGPAGDSGGAIQSGVGNTSAPGGVKVGYVGSDASVFVRALDSVTDTTVVAKPNILVLNRQRADLLVGQRLGYLSTTATDTSSTQTVEFLDVGTQLTVRPFISSEGTIRLELRPSVSDGSVTEQAGFVIPNETTQELVTNIIVEDGQTVVIGGLFKEDTTNSRSQVPGLGDVPLVGAAFKGKDDTVDRSEVIFLIKTTIMEPAKIARGGDAAEEAIRDKRLGAKEGLLPWSNTKLVSSNLITARKALEKGDTKKALWHVNLALHIEPTSADALKIKQEITGEKILFHDRSQLRHIMDSMIDDQSDDVAPKAQAQEAGDDQAAAPNPGTEEVAQAPAPAETTEPTAQAFEVTEQAAATDADPEATPQTAQAPPVESFEFESADADAKAAADEVTATESAVETFDAAVEESAPQTAEATDSFDWGTDEQSQATTEEVAEATVTETEPIAETFEAPVAETVEATDFEAVQETPFETAQATESPVDFAEPEASGAPVAQIEASVAAIEAAVTQQAQESFATDAFETAHATEATEAVDADATEFVAPVEETAAVEVADDIEWSFDFASEDAAQAQSSSVAEVVDADGLDYDPSIFFEEAADASVANSDESPAAEGNQGADDQPDFDVFDLLMGGVDTEEQAGQ